VGEASSPWHTADSQQGGSAGVCLHGAGISFIPQHQQQTWQELLLTTESHSAAAKL